LKAVFKNVQLPEDLHRHVKSLAANSGVSMIEVVARATGFSRKKVGVFVNGEEQKDLKVPSLTSVSSSTRNKEVKDDE
jgi:hypothetical protein